ncbi:MAG TPA: redoxin domain-containing protein [Thermoanaerobaculia bacterium]|nr:redoxin domain-containing protein [Thermoanaerobaculia bacterium]
MQKTLRVLILMALSLGTFAGVAQEQKPAAPAPEPLKIKVGDVAPDFTLLHFDGQKVQPVKLSDFRGKKNVILAFYVFAFTGG